MDQSVVAGVGNVYRAEVLFRQRLDPYRPGRERPSGRPRRVDAHYVYGRAALPCRLCGAPVQDALVAASRLFWCPVCQA